MTLRIRPRVSGPTGTRIGAPVSTTSWPRVRPSVASMAMARTAFSPRCCATSNTRRTFLPVRGSVLVVSSAFKIAGRAPSNSTSTTAPMIWIRRPLDLLMACLFLLDGGGAGDDFNQLLGDLRLTGTVHLNGEGFDHVARVACGIVHRRHLRRIETGLIVQHGGEQLHRDILGQQRFQNGVFIRFVIVEGGAF